MILHMLIRRLQNNPKLATDVLYTGTVSPRVNVCIE